MSNFQFIFVCCDLALVEFAYFCHVIAGSVLMGCLKSSVLPHLKKSNLDKENLTNYCPISHLLFLSKLTERAVKLRLTDFLSENNLLNSFQSAYIKSHSSETVLLSVHDHIMNAMSLQKVTCLTLLDLSAAFDIY